MRRIFQTPLFQAPLFQTPRTALSLALGLVLLAAVGLATLRFPGDSARPEGSLALLAALLSAGVVLSLFKPRRGIALGAAVLAPATLYFGPSASAAVAACLRASQMLIGRWTRARPAESAGLSEHAWDEEPAERSVPSSYPTPESLTGVLTVVLAALVASVVWAAGSLEGAGTARIGSMLLFSAVAGLAQAALLLAAGWIVVWAAPGRIADQWSPHLGARRPRRLDSRLLLETAGWMLGGVLAATFATAGVAVGLVVLAAVTLLALELVRQRAKLTRGRRQTMTLRQMSMVGRRLGGGESFGTQIELEPIVGQILRECRDLLEPQWLHLEIVDGDVERPSWTMGPEGAMEEGEPRPPETPPALPGVHRRVAWKIHDRALESGDRTIATLRFWTDPRRTEADKVRLLDSLLPQLASLLAAVLAERKAGRDALTGVASRAVLEERLELVYERCCAEGSSLAVVMCDVDRFKEINDRFGHSVGDRVLREIAGALALHSRGRDIVCRYGGEEFTILMDGANARAAVAVAERLRKAVEEIQFDADGTTILLTASFGVASFPDTYVASGADLVPLADAALYEAKRRGRNRTLLSLGQGRFENARGRRLKGDTKAEAIEAPRLFV